jgi:hypothetical protein
MQNLLSSSLLSKNVKTKIYRTEILSVVLYGCETWSLILREEYGLRVFENRVLRRIFESKRDDVTRTEMGRTCSTYGREWRCIQGFNGRISGKETT